MGNKVDKVLNAVKDDLSQVDYNRGNIKFDQQTGGVTYFDYPVTRYSREPILKLLDAGGLMNPITNNINLHPDAPFKNRGWHNVYPIDKEDEEFRYGGNVPSHELIHNLQANYTPDDDEYNKYYRAWLYQNRKLNPKESLPKSPFFGQSDYYDYPHERLAWQNEVNTFEQLRQASQADIGNIIAHKPLPMAANSDINQINDKDYRYRLAENTRQIGKWLLARQLNQVPFGPTKGNPMFENPQNTSVPAVYDAVNRFSKFMKNTFSPNGSAGAFKTLTQDYDDSGTNWQQLFAKEIAKHGKAPMHTSHEDYDAKKELWEAKNLQDDKYIIPTNQSHNIPFIVKTGGK